MQSVNHQHASYQHYQYPQANPASSRREASPASDCSGTSGDHPVGKAHLSPAAQQKIAVGEWLCDVLQANHGMNARLVGGAATALNHRDFRPVKDLDFHLVGINGDMPSTKPFIDSSQYSYPPSHEQQLDIAKLNQTIRNSAPQSFTPFTFNASASGSNAAFASGITGMVNGTEVSFLSMPSRHDDHTHRNYSTEGGLQFQGRRQTIVDKASAAAGRSNHHIQQGKLTNDLKDIFQLVSAMRSSGGSNGYTEITKHLAPNKKADLHRRAQVIDTMIYHEQLKIHNHHANKSFHAAGGKGKAPDYVDIPKPSREDAKLVSQLKPSMDNIFKDPQAHGFESIEEFQQEVRNIYNSAR